MVGIIFFNEESFELAYLKIKSVLIKGRELNNSLNNKVKLIKESILGICNISL